jgi:hypothetical protein
VPVSYPVVNGIRFDFSSIQFRVQGKIFPGIKSLNYNHALDPGVLGGTAAQDIGRTRGKYKAEGNIELFREDADDFLTLIAPASLITGGQTGIGFMEVSFDISVTFFEPIQGTGPAVQNDILRGCRIKKEDSSNSAGSDPSTLKYDLHIMLLTRNGKAPIAASQAINVRQ